MVEISGNEVRVPARNNQANTGTYASHGKTMKREETGSIRFNV
jgi:hypothetical protein